MFPQQGLSPAERGLLRLYRALSTADRDTLLAFGAFLAQRSAGEVVGTAPVQPVPAEPRPEERPEGESVIAALKRLRRVYPMVERGALLHEASSLMSAHVLQGRPAVDVINELESLFARHYEAGHTVHIGRQGD